MVDGISYPEWEKRAAEYVKNYNESGTASITSSTRTNNLTKEIITYSGTEYIKIGAFNLVYTGTFTNNVAVYNQNDAKVSVKYAKYNGNTLEVYDDINSAVKSGQDFYILVPANAGVSKINKIEFEVSYQAETLITDMWILQHDEGDEYQNLITVDTDIKRSTTTAKIQFTNIELFGGLIITKTDKDTGDKLANVGFRLKMVSGEKAGQYVSVNSNGNAVYSSSPTDMKTDANGQLVTSNGYRLVPEIVFPENFLVEQISISREGVVSVKIGDENDPVEIGQITLHRFINQAGLLSIGDNLYKETIASGPAFEGEPGANGFPRIHQGFVEMSNVKVVDEMVDMIVAQRAYEMNSKAVQTSDNLLATVVNLKR